MVLLVYVTSTSVLEEVPGENSLLSSDEQGAIIHFRGTYISGIIMGNHDGRCYGLPWMKLPHKRYAS